MQVTIFKEITTEEILNQLAAEGEKYDGLYVDMDNKKERKFVKDQAKTITDLLKKLDRSRIDQTAEAKTKIDKEFNVIVESLKKSNEPFTLLIDEYKAERKRILDAEKAAQKLKDDYFQMGLDHEEAINENELHDLRKEKQAREQKETEKRLLAQAEDYAKQAAAEAEEKRVRDVEQAKVDEQNLVAAIAEKEAEEAAQREADTANYKRVMTGVKESLMQSCQLDEASAKVVALAIKNGQIFNTSLQF